METQTNVSGAKDRPAILYVDDTPMLVNLVTQMLEALGYAAHGFAGASQALEAIREDQPRFVMVLADRAMPGMSGLELAQKVGAERPDLPFVLVTGLHDQALEKNYRKLNVREVLTKPFSSADLAACIQRQLGGDT